MAYPHRIRLRGPWDYAPLARLVQRAEGRVEEEPGELPPGGRMEVPSDWERAPGRGFRGRVAYRRRFSRPTNLSPHERVWLVCEGVDAYGRAALNGQPLGDIRGYALPAAFEVSAILAPRNELALEVDLPRSEPGAAPLVRPGRETLAGGPVGQVHLEVRPTLFPDHLRLELTHDGGSALLRIEGQLAGQGTWGDLALLVAGPDRELLYADVAPGQPFSFAMPPEGVSSWPAAGGPDKAALCPVEVRLISGGFRLWTAQFRTASRAIEWDPASGSLTVAGHEIRWPVSRMTAAETAVALRATPGELAPAGCASIQPAAVYDFLGESSLAVVQAMPVAWAGEVCPRLAHHPAIVAWTAPAAEIEHLPAEARQRGSFGRPWVPRELAFGP